jgi:YD repeat-containing protein
MFFFGAMPELSEAMVLRGSNEMKNELRLWVRTILAAATICMLSYQAASAQQGGTANYLYDANGRLITVLSPTGEAARYNYDAAGNFTSITRVAATTLSILDFTPGTGSVGTTVTIYGTGFSATPSANTVKFNGVTASVAAATKTRLDVQVPLGAAPGTISVTNTNGTINSSNQFFVITRAVYFNSRISFGESVIVPFNTICPVGSNPSSAAVLTFDGAAGQRVSLVAENKTDQGATCPTGFSPYATLRLISPGGVEVATEDMRDHTNDPSPYNLPPPSSPPYIGPFAFFEPITLTAAGTYSIEIDPRIGNIGMTVRLYDVSPDITGNIASDGTPFPLYFSSPGQNAQPTFVAAAGRRIAFRAVQVIADSPSGPTRNTDIASILKIVKPDTTDLVTPVNLFSAPFIEPVVLPVNGTYSVSLNPLYNKTRTTTLYLYDMPPDIIGNIVIGGAIVTVNIGTPGQIANLAFNVLSAQTVKITIPSTFPPSNTISDPLINPGTFTNVVISILNTSGTTVYSANFAVGGGTLAVPSLMAGNYTLRIDPAVAGVGKMDLRLTTP